MITKLPALIERANLDQKTVADRTGLSPTTVGKIYRGHFERLDMGTIETLCKFFGLKSISQLIDIEWEEGDVEGMSI